MKVKKSDFLDSKIDLLKKIIDNLSNDFEYVSILGTDSIGKSYKVSSKEIGVSDGMWNERGFVARVYNGKNYTEYSFNELSENNFNDIIESIKKEALNINKLNIDEISISTYPIIDEEKIKDEFYGDVKILPEEMKTNEIIEKLSKIKAEAFKLSDKLIDLKLNFDWEKVSKIFISKNKELKQSYIWSQAYVVPILKKEDEIKYSFKAFSGLKGLEIIDEMEDNYEKAIRHTENLLNAKKIKPGVYDVICSPEISGLIAHEAFGHGVEMDMFVKNRAKAQEYLNKEVASKLVNMHDGAKSANHVSSYLFDDEGTIGTDTKIIENGILKRGISDLLSALKLGTKPTGNGKRESYKRKAYARMTNTFFAPGDSSFEEMLSSIKEGIYLVDEMSGMEDPKNWGIQCMILSAIEIKDGKLTDNIYSPIILTGYVPELLKNISMVSKDLKLSGSGACGKGYKEWVKVSAGGPYIKTKARLG
ncbi:Zn-dependent protease [Tepiditoga spiralis]|uniref:Zn-dependent protease n=1 Tax=Tepiditoga spiralis TaxID=2108365 RepID=A0A7G1G9B0_9BACT|nr:TldD/PmbA family protein [Tepiditoga spiralis]BBE31527.1 Zn-dependent protease [Tepiditoga spiralis]